MQLADDFKEFLSLLNAHQVEYLVVGGYAVAYHGYPRATGDLDLWISSETSNAEKIVDVLRSFGFGVPGLSAELILRRKILRMGMPPIRIELMTQIAGVDFADCYSRRVEAHLDGVPAPLINLQDLKRNKGAAGRAKDQNDLENLP